MEMPTRSWWGWGWAENALGDAECVKLGARVKPFLPLDGLLTPVPSLPQLPPPRLAPPSALEDLFTADPLSRAGHAHGKAYRDVVRNLSGELANPPDWVAYPRTEEDVAAVLEWAGAAVVPYGGGSSVVGGVECRDTDRPWVSLDLSKMDAVLELDHVNLAMRAQAGIFGPALEDALRPHGLTLRHFPQSFEFSTLGGWLATRAGGHFATGYTHIDDLLQCLRVVTPAGTVATQRVPASGAGPEPNRVWLGSEGALGVITEAWVRVQRRPEFRSGASVSFPTFAAALLATREVAQSGLMPANCRLLDPMESYLGAGAEDGRVRLLLGFESADHPVVRKLDRALEICRGHGGRLSEKDAVGRWRGTFLQAPYLRDGLARLGVVVETFETACTWSSFEALHEAVVDAAAPGLVTCRFTHVYPDGPAPYFTVYAAGRRGGEVEIWDEIKRRVSDALIAHGATITHHHAVGRDHLPWYRPGLFGDALQAVKRTFDPKGILNPGVLNLR